MSSSTRLRRSHFAEYWQFYLGALCLAALLSVSAWLIVTKRSSARDVSKWTVTTAAIKESTVRESTGADGRRMEVDLRLSYRAEDQPYDVRYRADGAVTAAFPASRLAEGQEIEIRYNPKGPSIVSLAPLAPEANFP